MRIVFIQPCVGRRKETVYPKTWLMEPLGIAVLSSLTPPEWERIFFDDRFCEIDFSVSADAVCICVECYTAARSFMIAAEYRCKGIPVIMGGFHPTLSPEECARHADSVVSGEAENIWGSILSDIKNHTLKPFYRSDVPARIETPDRSIFGNRNYGPVALVETSRGCRFSCDFCSITKFFGASYMPRPLDEIVSEIKSLRKNIIFFVDDNLAMDTERLKQLCRKLIPLRKKWVAQLSIHAAQDEELLDLMCESRCAGVLIGFESLDPANLEAMGKKVNRTEEFRDAVENLRRRHLSVYATFVFGYDNDTPESFRRTLEFAMECKFFFAAFNHLVPFPGTEIYKRLREEKRLLHDEWWTSSDFSFGDVVFTPRNFTPAELSEYCHLYRREFYSLPSVIRRGFDLRANSHDLVKFLFFITGNLTQNREIERRRLLPFGGSL